MIILILLPKLLLIMLLLILPTDSTSDTSNNGNSSNNNNNEKSVCKYIQNQYQTPPVISSGTAGQALRMSHTELTGAPELES